MGSEFTFYDYMEERENLVRKWLKLLSAPVQAKFAKWLLHLEATPITVWRRPYVALLSGHCSGLFEVRVRDPKGSSTQYRLLGCHGPGKQLPTLLYGFIKPGDAVDVTECDRAFDRKELVDADSDKYRELHRYN